MDPVIHRSSLCPFIIPMEQKCLKVTTARHNSTSPGASDSKEYACNAGAWIRFLGRNDPLEKGMAARSSILAWIIPWTEEPGGLHPWGHKESDTTEQLTLSLFHFHMTLSHNQDLLHSLAEILT